MFVLFFLLFGAVCAADCAASVVCAFSVVFFFCFCCLFCVLLLFLCVDFRVVRALAVALFLLLLSGRQLLKNPPLPLLTFQNVKNNFTID